ncbi:MAG: sensor histidine kinase KdpD [Acidobacteria bacterium]|nr:sensor histidine kinase KdpD [Acidobacteriota bacterium]
MIENNESRPNPDLLLERAQREENAVHKGKLKIFFGAAPGVGKTFAMLESAQAKKAAGADVVVGVIETHGRAETAAKLTGLEILPRTTEFDLDAALKRKPELILIDELAHTNAKGSRHLKRWQDVEELLADGIDVYSTLNVQHVESLNDVVAQITGVIVRETVPDQVVELASEMELIDLPVEELIDRMKDGKIYVPEQAERALVHFFKPGNLNALREMALRRTAVHVDTNVVALRGEKTWPVAERLLLAIGPSPYAQNLIRATKRLATQWEAPWCVLYVETGAHASYSAAERERIQASLELAESLGAETAKIGGQSVAQSVLEFARMRNVTRIIVGKSPGSKLAGALLESSGEISVIALDGGGKLERPIRPRVSVPPGREIVEAFLWIAAATAIAMMMRETISQTNIVMVYLLAVIAVASRYSRETAIFTSILGVASFDFFCVRPYLTFAVSDVEYLLTFLVMLFVSIVISTLTVRLRNQASAAIERENRTQSLFRLSKELADVQRLYEVAESLAAIAAGVFRSGVNVFLPDAEGKLSFRRRLANGLLPPVQEEGVAQWCFDHGLVAGKESSTLPGATVRYQPLSVRGKCFGVFAIEEPPRDSEQVALLNALLAQAAQAMDRLVAREAARQAAVAAEGEQLRSSLLSAVSHDLRTPLTSIAGAASTLLDQRDQLGRERRDELLVSIGDESKRLNRLVGNLLEMTRLENGPVKLRLEWCSLEEIVGSVVDQMDDQFAGRELKVSVAPDLPLIEAEAQLLAQALQNLLENAVKYTPPASAIEVRAERAGSQLRLSVLDEGPGLPRGEEGRVFEKFYRGEDGGSRRGVGLGLAIVKSIVQAHGGQVAASNRPGHGAQFEILLPLKKS